MTGLVARARAIPSWQITLSIALLVLGFLIAAQLAAEGPRVQYTTQERSPLVETAVQLQAQQDALKAQILDLRNRIQSLEAQGPGAAASLKQLYADLGQAKIAAGLTALTGPGAVFRLEDSSTLGAADEGLVTANDVRVLVEQLWLAGAEAIAVNGERVTVSTAILDIGGSVLVNSAYLAPPYTIAVIGPPDIYERLQQSASFRAFFLDRVQRVGLGLSVAELDSVDVPAFAGTVSVRFGTPDASATPIASSPPASSATP
ncbi:MAG TPA: DUF881 domain-containing protein [Candidatus Limnocylindrales bacterium]|nr:DUF881 domain-containing protein [Candidatus Limnocylindrales bacterium]